MKISNRWFAGIALTLFALVAQARTIPYGPYSQKPSFPGVQSRTNRYFVVVETEPQYHNGITSIPSEPYPAGSLVLYDSTGAEDPRVILPSEGRNVQFTALAVREHEVAGRTIPVILIQTLCLHCSGVTFQFTWRLSDDGGFTWTTLAGWPVSDPLDQSVTQMPGYAMDHGAGYVNGRYSSVRIGTEATPFVVDMPEAGVIVAVDANGTFRRLKTLPWFFDDLRSRIYGSDRDGRRFIVRTSLDTLEVLDLAGNSSPLATVGTDLIAAEGWITPANDVYLEMREPGAIRLRLIQATGGSIDVGPVSPSSPALRFAVPTHDYVGAWLIDQPAGGPTTLLHHDRVSGTVTQWSDPSAPHIDAIHTGASGSTLLIQASRRRPLFDGKVPNHLELAIWRKGEPPPHYDELLVDLQFAYRGGWYRGEDILPTSGFVHLDVDAAAAGAEFIFDSGPTYDFAAQSSGLVRASLRQKLLLLPGVGRTAGAQGSHWVSDLVIENPDAAAQSVIVQFIQNGESQSTSRATLTLQPNEIRLVPDVVMSLFQLASANGALSIVPERTVNATSRTYTMQVGGSYGFSMRATDALSATGTRLPISFAGAFPGEHYRTNLIVTDGTSSGASASIVAVGSSGVLDTHHDSVTTPGSGQAQLNGVSTALNLGSTETGGMLLQTTRGALIASLFAIDNRTNDPTYFPLDHRTTRLLLAPEIIPAIGHVNGANGSQFRSDLYLQNPCDCEQSVALELVPWDGSVPEKSSLVLNAQESRMLPDVLFTTFNRSGVATLRISSRPILYSAFAAERASESLEVGALYSNGENVRVTSRTYSVAPDGGTYGFAMPPVDNSQIAGAGESLEILGAINDPGFRTNLGLVELNGDVNRPQATVKVEILDAGHHAIDTFTVTLPAGRGTQINDIFRARNIQATTATPILIRVSVVSGTVGAYATMVDNGTNDPAYLAANPGDNNQ
jgi:hypothetical protein